MEEQLLFSIKNIFLQVIEDTSRYTKQEEQKLLQQCKQLQHLYLLELCQPQVQASMETLVHTCQNMIGCLLNYLYEAQQKEPSPFFTKLSSELVSFLTFLEAKSGISFNHDALMPEIIWQPIQESIVTQFNNGSNFLFEKIDVQLLTILQQAFQETTASAERSFRRVYYWQALMQLFTEYAQSTLFNTQTCVELLLHVNFNHPALIGYVHNEFLYAYTNTENVHVHWQASLQFINRIIALHNKALLHNEASCYSILLQRVQMELSVLSALKKSTSVSEKRTAFAFKLNISQIAVFYRAQVEAGIIHQDNTSEMIRNLIESLPPSRSGNISFKNFYNKYHDPDRATLKIMLEYNTRMQHFLKSQLL